MKNIRCIIGLHAWERIVEERKHGGPPAQSFVSLLKAGVNPDTAGKLVGNSGVPGPSGQIVTYEHVGYKFCTRKGCTAKVRDGSFGWGSEPYADFQERRRKAGVPYGYWEDGAFHGYKVVQVG